MNLTQIRADADVVEWAHTVSRSLRPSRLVNNFSRVGTQRRHQRRPYPPNEIRGNDHREKKCPCLSILVGHFRRTVAVRMALFGMNSGNSEGIPRRSAFRPDIEGLRGVAVLAVVLFHCYVPAVRGGFIGVDVFFVISGFLITGLLWREVRTSGTIKLSRFFGARARRLLPAAATVGIVTAIASVVLLNPLQVKSVIGDGIASALYVGNYRFALQGVNYQIAYNPPSPFQHYWSLGVEEQFYLVWPAMIIGTAWLARPIGPRAQPGVARSAIPYLLVLAAVSCSSFAVSLAATHLAPSVAFFSLPTRAWELGVGGLVAFTTPLWKRLPVPWAATAGWSGLALIVLASNRIGAATPYPGIAALFPVLGTALVIVAGCSTPVRGCGHLLASPPMRSLGRVSYSWYLWHWPVLLFAAPWLARPGIGPAALGVSFGLAVLTLRFVENPFRYAPSVRSSAARSLAVGGIATALAVCTGLAMLYLIPNPIGNGPAASPLVIRVASPPTGQSVEPYDFRIREVFAQVQAAILASNDVKAVPSNLDPPLIDANRVRATGSSNCLLDLLEVDQPECVTGDTSSSITVALIGDSNAAMWAPALEKAATEQHWRLTTLTKGSCPMLDLPFYNGLLQRKYTECDQWRSRVITRLQHEPPQLVVLSMLRHDSGAGFPPYDHAWVDSLTRLVQQLQDAGSRVLVLGPIPDLQSNVPECLSAHLDDATACSAPRAKAVDERGMAAERAAISARDGRQRYADVTALFCSPDRCPAIVGNTLVYHNQFHLTQEYALALAPAISALADRALFADF